MAAALTAKQASLRTAGRNWAANCCRGLKPPDTLRPGMRGHERVDDAVGAKVTVVTCERGDAAPRRAAPRTGP